MDPLTEPLSPHSNNVLSSRHVLQHEVTPARRAHKQALVVKAPSLARASAHGGVKAGGQNIDKYNTANVVVGADGRPKVISMDLADTVNSDLDKITTISPVAPEALSPQYDEKMSMAEAMPIVEDVDATI